MQSFLHGSLLYDSGYFHVWISSEKDTPFFTSSKDKAYFISLLQDNLSPRTPRRYAREIDLLAYSLTESGIHLLMHTTRKTAIEELGQALLTAYIEHIQQTSFMTDLPFDTIFIFDKLNGRHEALDVSREIHLLHEDWRNDRYSSIGFYLDDRRGDWLRPYRLTSIFGAKPNRYLQFIKSVETESDRIFKYIET